MICIISKRENFRRCGISHPKAATEHPDDTFSKDEIAILESEPMLAVEHIIAKTPAFGDMTVAELKELLGKLKVPYAGNATKAVLIDLVEANTAEPPAKE
jgi:hypothetical protein